MLVLDDQIEWNGSKACWFTHLSQAWAHKVEHNQGYAFKKTTGRNFSARRMESAS
jgi:hypothetical protein